MSYLNEGIFGIVGVIITGLSGYAIAKFTRNSSREANQTAGWTNLVAALQEDVKELRKEEDETKAYIKELDLGNRHLSQRIYVLERSRHRWKGWGQQVVDIMNARGVPFPKTPEPLNDTDPNMLKDKDKP